MSMPKKRPKTIKTTKKMVDAKFKQKVGALLVARSNAAAERRKKLQDKKSS